tara:strand:- start:2363 stop:2584 length:222 start_codon:yes stop_codon:yes gene_type:complete
MSVNLKGILLLNKKKRVKIGNYRGKYKTKKIKKINKDQLNSLLMIMPEKTTLAERLTVLTKKTRKRRTRKRRR